MESTRIEIDGRSPECAEGSWVAANATLAGNVRLGHGSSIWYGAVLRSESETITVGRNSNIQDGSILHVDPGYPLTIGENVSIGHRAVLHGCTIEDGSLVGMGAVVLNGAVIGAGSLVAAGALVLEGTVIPAGSLVAGVPCKIRRPLTSEEQAGLLENAITYALLRDQHAAAV